jgi:hypothetical protein
LFSLLEVKFAFFFGKASSKNGFLPIHRGFRQKQFGISLYLCILARIMRRKKPYCRFVSFQKGTMNKANVFCAVMVMMFLGMIASAQTTATLTDLATTAPTPGPYDIFQLGISGQVDMPDGLNYYTDDQVNQGNGEPGQTFTTGSGASGYTLTSLAIKTGGGTSSGTGTPQSYLLHIYSVSGGTATLLATYSATNFSFNDGDWLQWSGLNVSLSTSTAYAYSFGKGSTAVSGWDGMGNASGNVYVGGELGLMPVAGGSITFGGSHNYDAVFDVGLTANGPATVAVVTNSPATAIQTKSATLNGKIVYTGGSTPRFITEQATAAQTRWRGPTTSRSARSQEPLRRR